MKRATQLKLFGYWCRLQGLFGEDYVGKAALKKFVQPPKPLLTPKQVHYLDSARQTMLSVQGKNVAVYEWGDAEAPYVFSAYGWAYNAGRWRHFAPQLIEAGYRFVGVDYYGHGRSEYAECDYPTMVNLLKHVVLHFGQPALVLAHSFGAGLSIQMLSQLPQDLHPKRLAALAGFSSAEYIFRQYTGALGFSERQHGSFVSALERRTGSSVDELDPAVKSMSLGHIEALIAHDPKEEVTSFSNAVRLAEHFPDAYLYEAHGAGHGFTEENTSKAVLRWLIDGVVPENARRLGQKLTPAHTDHNFRSNFFR